MRGVSDECTCVCVCVCLKRNIFLYYYSHRAYFSYPPTCIPGGWVCSFSLSFFSLSLFSRVSLFLSLCFFFSPARDNGKDSTLNRVVPFLCAHRHEKLRGAPSSAQEPRKRSASIKHSPCLSASLLSSLALSTIERRLLTPALT